MPCDPAGRVPAPYVLCQFLCYLPGAGSGAGAGDLSLALVAEDEVAYRPDHYRRYYQPHAAGEDHRPKSFPRSCCRRRVHRVPPLLLPVAYFLLLPLASFCLLSLTYLLPSAYFLLHVPCQSLCYCPGSGAELWRIGRRGAVGPDPAPGGRRRTVEARENRSGEWAATLQAQVQVLSQVHTWRKRTAFLLP